MIYEILGFMIYIFDNFNDQLFLILINSFVYIKIIKEKDINFVWIC